MDENGIVGNKKELAKHFGKSVRTVERWIGSGMPVLPSGRFDVFAVTAWRRRKKGAAVPGVPQASEAGADSSQAVPDVPGGDKDSWDRESKKYQAKLRELDFRKRCGELVEASKVQDFFVARISAVKAGLIAFERTLVPDLIACRSEREMSVVIRKQVRNLLEAFSRPIPAGIIPEGRQDIDHDDLGDL